MTKNEIAIRIAEEMDINQTDAKRVVQMVLDEIIRTIAGQGRLELRNFGIFEVRTRKARKGRNPRTGADVMVPECKVVSFKPGMAMQECVGKKAPAVPVTREKSTPVAGLTI